VPSGRIIDFAEFRRSAATGNVGDTTQRDDDRCNCRLSDIVDCRLLSFPIAETGVFGPMAATGAVGTAIAPVVCG
jgi:hypothetical protein